MGLTKQTLALDALGVDRRSYLWAPAWLSAALCYLAVATLFALGMIAGGIFVCRSYGITNSWELLTGDLLDPRPERVRYAVRALFLVWIYAWGIASDVVAKGGAPKPEADSVTRGMTASVVACTLWVVAWELVTVLVVFRLCRRRSGSRSSSPTWPRSCGSPGEAAAASSRSPRLRERSPRRTAAPASCTTGGRRRIAVATRGRSARPSSLAHSRIPITSRVPAAS
jgi:hypothetical protein